MSKPGMVARAFNADNLEVKAGRALSSRPPWSTQQAPVHSDLHNENLSQKEKKMSRVDSP